jgi:hypothetical protein
MRSSSAKKLNKRDSSTVLQGIETPGFFEHRRKIDESRIIFGGRILQRVIRSL